MAVREVFRGSRGKRCCVWSKTPQGKGPFPRYMFVFEESFKIPVELLFENEDGEIVKVGNRPFDILYVYRNPDKFFKDDRFAQEFSEFYKTFVTQFR